MSFQFEDESALEELLNQQLERRRQPQQQLPNARQTRPSTGIPPQQSTTSNQANSLTSNVPSSRTRPASPNAARTDIPQMPTGSREKGKLSSWLDKSPKDTAPIEASESKTSDLAARAALSASRKAGPRINAIKSIQDIIEQNDLQTMSKQRLIQFIQEELVPNFERQQAQINEDLIPSSELIRVKHDLEAEQTRANLIALRHEEQEKLIESKWAQINDQLKSRLEINEKELRETIERQQKHLDTISREHQEQLRRLNENNLLRLNEEKKLNEEALKRHEEFHKLELESKLKVNFDLVNLETIFSEWQNMIRSTIEELNQQFKSIEALLDRQTLKVMNTNKELEVKSQLVIEQQRKFDDKSEMMSQVAKRLDEILPKVIEFQLANDKWAKETKEQTGELNQRLIELRSKENQLKIKEDELQLVKDKLGEENLKIQVELNRLSLKSEQLDQLNVKLKAKEEEYEVKFKLLQQHDSELESIRLQQDVKGSELRHLNNELLYARRKLSLRESQVQQQKVDLSNEKQQLKLRSIKLNDLRNKIHKESDQLKRLQHSLVCSICLVRLFPQNESSYDDSRKQQQFTDKDFKAKIPSKIKTGNFELQSAANLQFSEDLGDNEIAELSKCIELDVERLKRENKYIELISMN